MAQGGFLRSASRLGALLKGSFGVCTTWSGIPCILGKSCKGLVVLKKCGYLVMKSQHELLQAPRAALLGNQLQQHSNPRGQLWAEPWGCLDTRSLASLLLLRLQ